MVYKKTPVKSKTVEEIVGKPEPNGEAAVKKEVVTVQKVEEEVSKEPVKLRKSGEF